MVDKNNTVDLEPVWVVWIHASLPSAGCSHHQSHVQCASHANQGNKSMDIIPVVLLQIAANRSPIGQNEIHLISHEREAEESSKNVKWASVGSFSTSVSLCQSQTTNRIPYRKCFLPQMTWIQLLAFAQKVGPFV